MNRIAIANAHLWNAERMRHHEREGGRLAAFTRSETHRLAKLEHERHATRHRANCDALERLM